MTNSRVSNTKNVYREKRNWYVILFQWRSSVVPAILPRVIFCGVFGFLVSWFYHLGFNVSLPVLGNIVPSIVLGLLLVFRTNTAYERFWEGRKLWGHLVNTSRNMCRTIWVSVEEHAAEDRGKKVAALRLLVAFAIATKLHLRGESVVDEELSKFVSPQQLETLKNMNNPPLEIAFWIGDYFQLQYELKRINAYQLIALSKLLDMLVDVLGGCERILRTPMPLAYSIHLKQLLLIYCLTVPFQIVRDLGWSTGIIVSVISFTVFGIEEIGIEIENPFGHDINDIPLDNICKTMAINIEDLITLSPSVRSAQNYEYIHKDNF